MLICYTATKTNDNIMYHIINTDHIDLDLLGFHRLGLLDTDLDIYTKDKLFTTKNKIIGLDKTKPDYIDTKVMNKDNDYKYNIEIFTFNQYLLVGNYQNLYLYNLSNNKYIGKIKRIDSLEIGYFEILDKTLKLCYNIPDRNYLVNMFNQSLFKGVVDYTITDKGIKLPSKTVQLMAKGGRAFDEVDFPVSFKYAYDKLYSLGLVNFDVDREECGTPRLVGHYPRMTELTYKIIDSKLCVGLCVMGMARWKYVYFVSDTEVYKQHIEEPDQECHCIYRQYTNSNRRLKC
jgi:hypothetical protein